jgi:WD40 repeat protein
VTAPLPVRLVDYFAVMVSSPVPPAPEADDDDDDDEEEEEDEHAAFAGINDEEGDGEGRAGRGRRVLTEADEVYWQDGVDSTDALAMAEEDADPSVFLDPSSGGKDQPPKRRQRGAGRPLTVTRGDLDSDAEGSYGPEPTDGKDASARRKAGKKVSKQQSQRRRQEASKKRVGRIQFRYPKADHPDLPLPESSADWFIFPNGVCPIVARDRPRTRKSVFVQTNVGTGKGGNASGMQWYGCCLTAFRQEALADDADEDDEAEGGEGLSGGDDDGDSAAPGTSKSSARSKRRSPRRKEAVWWPVVLFMLTRYPVVPLLQRVLDTVYDAFDGGMSTDAGVEPAPAFCSLNDYLRMLVFEAPLPIRRAALAVQLFLPGDRPRSKGLPFVVSGAEDAAAEEAGYGGGVCTAYLPPPDALPLLQFDARPLASKLGGANLLAVLCALLSERRIAFVAQTVQELVEASETFLPLLHPFLWEMPYVPVLPAHLAVDCLANPVPFVYGLLTCYAGRVLSGLSPEDADQIIIVDLSATTPGGARVDVGCTPYLTRKKDAAVARLQGLPLPASSPAASAAGPTIPPELRFPEPLASEGAAEIDALLADGANVRGTADDQPLSGGLSLAAAAFNQQLQGAVLRFMALLLHGYRRATFFPGLPPQYVPLLASDALLEVKGAVAAAAAALAKAKGGASTAAAGSLSASAREFLRGLCDTQMMSRLLQRHPSGWMRAFHSLCAHLASVNGNAPTFADARKWTIPVGPTPRILVVPPPGYADLGDWQLKPSPTGDIAVSDFLPSVCFAPAPTGAARRYTRLLPDVGDLPEPVKPKKKKKQEESALARRFPADSVSAVLAMNETEARVFGGLIDLSASQGLNGPRGDDIGGPSEAGSEDAAAETSALLQAAAELAGKSANPATGRQRTTGSSAAASGRQKLVKAISKRGFFSRLMAADQPSLGAAATSEENAEAVASKVHAWLQTCLVTSGQSSASDAPASGANIYGVAWDKADDALVASLGDSGIGRGAFARALQSQVLLSAGLPAPPLPSADAQSGGNEGPNGSPSSLAAGMQSLAQLQGWFGMGLTPPTAPWMGQATGASGSVAALSTSTFAAPSAAGAASPSFSNSSARPLLQQGLPLPRFLRLAAMSAALLSHCLEQKDFITAAALVQCAQFFFADVQKDATTASAIQRAATKGFPSAAAGANGAATTSAANIGTAWGVKRQFLFQELAGEALCRSQGFWEAFVAHAVLLEEARRRTLQSALTGSVSPGGKAAAPSGSSASAVLQGVVPFMQQLGLSQGDVKALVPRISTKYRLSGAEDRSLSALIEKQASATAAAPTLLCYNIFTGGGSAIEKANALGHNTVLVITPGAASRATASSRPPVAAAAASPAPAAEKAKAKPAPAPAPAKKNVKFSDSEGSESDDSNDSDDCDGSTDSEAKLPTAAKSKAAAVSGDSAAKSNTAPSQPAKSDAKAAAPASAPALAAAAEDEEEEDEAGGQLDQDGADEDTGDMEGGEEVDPHIIYIPAHPWAHLSPAEADASAATLVATRRYPPAPELGSLDKKKSFIGKVFGGAKDSAGKSQVQLPAGGITRTEAEARDAEEEAAANAAAEAAPAPAPAPAPKLFGKPGKMEVVKAFGHGVGLSVIASTFAAALPGAHRHKEGGAEGSAAAPATPAKPAEDIGLLDSTLKTLTRAAMISRLGPGAIHDESLYEGLPASIAVSCLGFKGHAPGASITAMSHDTEDHRVATGGNDGRVSLWDMTSRTYVHTYEDHSAAVTALKVCGDLVVSASQDGLIRLASFARLALGTGGGIRPPAHVPTGFWGSAKKAAPASPAPSTPSRKAKPGASDESSGESREGDEKPDVSYDHEVDGASDGMGVAGGSDDYLASPSTPSKGPSNAHGLFGLPLTFPFPVPSMLGGSGAKSAQDLMYSMKLKGHSGPVTALDAWERKPEPPKPVESKGSWNIFARKGGKDTSDNTAPPPPPPASLPAATNYVIVSGGADGSVRAWSAKWNVDKKGRSSGDALHLATYGNLHKSSTIIESLKLSVDGRLCVSAGRDGRIGVMDIATGKTWCMRMAEEMNRGGLFGLKKKVVSNAPDAIAAPTGLPVVTCSIDVTRRPVMVTSAGTDGTARVWDLRTGLIAAAFPSGYPVWSFTTVPAHGGGSPVYDAEGNPLSPPSPIGDVFLMTAHEDGVVRKWDCRKPSMPLAAWTGHNAPITSLTSYGDKLLSGGVDGSVRLWDATSGLSLMCAGHTSQVSGVSLSDDYMMTSSWDGTLRCWFPVST